MVEFVPEGDKYWLLGQVDAPFAVDVVCVVAVDVVADVEGSCAALDATVDVDVDVVLQLVTLKAQDTPLMQAPPTNTYQKNPKYTWSESSPAVDPFAPPCMHEAVAAHQPQGRPDTN